MATRKPRSPKTPVADAVDAQIKSETSTPEPTASAWQAFKDSLPDLEHGWQRQAVSVTVGILVSCGIGYAMGVALGFMLIGASACGIGVFTQTVMYLIGVCISAYLGRNAGTAVCEAIADGSLESLATGAYDHVRGWFTPQPQGASA